MVVGLARWLVWWCCVLVLFVVGFLLVFGLACVFGVLVLFDFVFW